MVPLNAFSSGLGAVLDSLAGLEARHRDRSFEALRTAVIAEEADAWQTFVEKYSRFAYAVALKLLAGSGDRDEAAASIYTRVFERLQARDHRLLREFNGRCAFTTYLFRIVQSERKDYFQKSRLRAHESLEDVTPEIESTDEPIEPEMRPGFAREIVHAAFESASAAEKTLLLCRFRDGLKLREIATVFGLKDTNAAARALGSALSKLERIKLRGASERFGAAERCALEDAVRSELLALGGATDE